MMFEKYSERLGAEYHFLFGDFTNQMEKVIHTSIMT